MSSMFIPACRRPVATLRLNNPTVHPVTCSARSWTSACAEAMHTVLMSRCTLSPRSRSRPCMSPKSCAAASRSYDAGHSADC